MDLKLQTHKPTELTAYLDFITRFLLYPTRRDDIAAIYNVQHNVDK